MVVMLTDVTKHMLAELGHLARRGDNPTMVRVDPEIRFDPEDAIADQRRANLEARGGA